MNIQAHKDVEFKIIKRVMFSCATAGYNNINFAVLTKGDGAAGSCGQRRRARAVASARSLGTKPPSSSPRASALSGRGVRV